MQSDVVRLSWLTQFQWEKNESRNLAIEIDNYGQDELLRQAELVTMMQGLCSHYIEELFESMLFQVDNITLNQHHSLMHALHTSMSSVMQRWFDHKMSMYEQEVKAYTDSYRPPSPRPLSRHCKDTTSTWPGSTRTSGLSSRSCSLT